MLVAKEYDELLRQSMESWEQSATHDKAQIRYSLGCAAISFIGLGVGAYIAIKGSPEGLVVAGVSGAAVAGFGRQALGEIDNYAGSRSMSTLRNISRD